MQISNLVPALLAHQCTHKIYLTISGKRVLSFVSILEKMDPVIWADTSTVIAYLSGAGDYIMQLPETDISPVMDDLTKMMEMTDSSL